MNQRNNETVAHQAADVVDNIADGIRSAAHSAGGSVRSAAHTVREAASSAADTVGETCEEVGRYARDSVHEVQAQARSCEDGLESYVRANPKTSVLLAAAFGAVIVALWKR